MSRREGLSLRGNMLWNSAGSTIRLVCNYLITIAVVRLSHGFDAAGTLSLAMSIANLVLPFADFRLRTLHVTDVSQERSSGAYVGLRILTSALSFLIGVVYSAATNSPGSLLVISLYLVYSIITNFIEVFHAIDQRALRMDISGKSYMMQGASNLIAFSAVLWLTNSLVLAVISLSLTTLMIGLVYDMPRAARFEPIRPIVEWRPAVTTLAALLPLVLAQVASSAVLTIPKQQLALLAGDSALGIYSSVAAPALIVQMGATYVYSPLMGTFAEQFATDKRAAVRLLGKTTAVILAVTAALSVLLLLFGGPILHLLFGRQILEYTYLLQPMLLCTLLTAFAWFMNDLLLALRDFKASFFGNIVAAAITAAGSTYFVTAFGMNGVSWVGIVAYAVAVAILVLFFIRDYRRLDR
ncbi:lipopolysaccharide biosynthesis protein [Actinomyces mediterranea]|uniref:lipopolysaccharide biosynthesis protein n=1 Tax=Actinomyces mediterranea TaxID=1871028 RepID=UPI000970B79F|nr:polysaccharide biosynthesis protein [Actinomyces mediterranea]